MTSATEQPMAALPAEARALITRYLDEVDAALPGLVEGLYVVGSIALGAWQIGPSDIDTLILTSGAADADERAVLAKIHAGMPGGPYFDGVYLDRDTFGAATDRSARRSVLGQRQFRTDKPCGELNPVVWPTRLHQPPTSTPPRRRQNRQT